MTLHLRYLSLLYPSPHLILLIGYIVLMFLCASPLVYMQLSDTDQVIFIVHIYSLPFSFFPALSEAAFPTL